MQNRIASVSSTRTLGLTDFRRPRTAVICTQAYVCWMHASNLSRDLASTGATEFYPEQRCGKGRPNKGLALAPPAFALPASQWARSHTTNSHTQRISSVVYRCTRDQQQITSASRPRQRRRGALPPASFPCRFSPNAPAAEGRPSKSLLCTARHIARLRRSARLSRLGTSPASSSSAATLRARRSRRSRRSRYDTR